MNANLREELETLQLTYLMAKAVNKKMIEREKDIEDFVGRNLKLITEEGEPCTHHNDYMLSDEDSKIYFKAVYEKGIACGLKLKGEGFTFTAETGPALKIAENNLIAFVENNLKISEVLKISPSIWDTMKNDYRYRDELLNITARLDGKTVPDIAV